MTKKILKKRQSQTICSISGGRISIKVLAASFLIELFLIGPRGRSAIFHSVIIKQFLMFAESKGIQMYQRRSWRQTRRWSWWSSACCPCSPGRRSAPSKCSTWLGQPEGDQYSSIPIMFGFFIKSELHQEYHRHHHLCHSQTHLSSPLQFVLALLYHRSKLTKSEIELRL